MCGRVSAWVEVKTSLTLSINEIIGMVRTLGFNILTQNIKTLMKCVILKCLYVWHTKPNMGRRSAGLSLFDGNSEIKVDNRGTSRGSD